MNVYCSKHGVVIKAVLLLMAIALVAGGGYWLFEEMNVNEAVQNGSTGVIALFIGLVNFAWLGSNTVTGLLWRWIDSIAERERKRTESWTIDAILIPICVNPTRELIETITRDVRLLANDSQKIPDADREGLYTQMLRKFKNDLDLLRDRFQILQHFDEDAFATASSILEQLEDDVTTHCAMKISKNKLEAGERKMMNEKIVSFAVYGHFKRLMAIVSDLS